MPAKTVFRSYALTQLQVSKSVILKWLNSNILCRMQKENHSMERNHSKKCCGILWNVLKQHPMIPKQRDTDRDCMAILLLMQCSFLKPSGLRIHRTRAMQYPLHDTGFTSM